MAISYRQTLLCSPSILLRDQTKSKSDSFDVRYLLMFQILYVAIIVSSTDIMNLGITEIQSAEIALAQLLMMSIIVKMQQNVPTVDKVIEQIQRNVLSGTKRNSSNKIHK